MHMFNSVMRCIPMLQKRSTIWLKCTKITLDLSVLPKYFPLATWNVNTWHLPLVCSLISSPCILKCKTTISSIPMCYVKCQNVNIVTLKSHLCWQIVSYWQSADVTLWKRSKSRDHEIVRAQKKVSKGCPKTPPKSCSVVIDPQV